MTSTWGCVLYIFVSFTQWAKNCKCAYVFTVELPKGKIRSEPQWCFGVYAYCSSLVTWRKSNLNTCYWDVVSLSLTLSSAILLQKKSPIDETLVLTITVFNNKTERLEKTMPFAPLVLEVTLWRIFMLFLVFVTLINI